MLRDIILLPLALALAAQSTSAQVAMTISRHVSVSLSEKRADQILADARKVLAGVDGKDDVSCDVDFRRSGPIATFTGSDVIEDETDMVNVCAQTGNVHLVSMIDWCGVPGDYRGCANATANCMVVVREVDWLEGILWAHEFGHTQGLHHRNVPNALMDEKLYYENRRVLAWECAAFPYTAASGTPTISGQSSSPSPTPPPAAAPGPPPDIATFVRQTYIHGIPYQLAVQYPQTVVPKLLAMLGDAEESEYRANIVTTLCMLGREGDVTDAAIAVLEHGKGTLALDEYRAKKAALLGLGYLANNGEPRAFDYLQQSIDPQVWNNRLEWQAPAATALARNVRLSNTAVWALVLSGRPEVRPILERLDETKNQIPNADFQKKLSDLLQSIIRDYDFVQKEGLRAYEDRRHEF